MLDRIVIDYVTRQSASDDHLCLQEWTGTVRLLDAEFDRAEPIGHVGAYVLLYEELPDPVDTLDEISDPLAELGRVLFDQDTGQLHEVLEREIDMVGFGALIIDTVELADRFRGAGLGPLVAGMVIERLGPGRRFVAAKPEPIGVRKTVTEPDLTDEDRTRACDRLGKLANQLGFEAFADGVWTLNLALVTFPQRMVELRERLSTQRL